MRKLLIAVLFALPFVALAAPPKTVTLDVQNMTCGLCPITVKKSLEKVSGVSDLTSALWRGIPRSRSPQSVQK